MWYSLASVVQLGQCGRVWYSMVTIGYHWYSVIQYGTVCDCVVQLGTAWYSGTVHCSVTAKLFTLPTALHEDDGDNDD